MREKTDLKLTAGRAKTDRVVVISSKSYVHRLLIGAFLCDEKPEVITNIVSDDMKATMEALARLPDHKNDRVIDCGESGSTARFLLPLAAALCDKATLTGRGRLPERPMGPLCEALRKAGVNVSDDHLPITVSGKPAAGEYELPGNVSSQYITGLLFMLPILDGTSHLKITGKLESAAYVDMTLDVLARFGIRVDKCDDGYMIKGPQKYSYTAAKTLEAEGDWSNAAYLMALASLGCGKSFDSFTIEGLNPESKQGDRAVTDIFGQFGINVEKKPAGDGRTAAYTIKGRPVNPVDIDCSQIPDLVPALAVLAAYADGDSTFRNVERLRIKECDRVDAITDMLAAAGREVDIISKDSAENMFVRGRLSQPEPSVLTIESSNDHRIAMAAAALAFAQDQPVIIKDAFAVNKSYPGFYEIIDKMGISSCRLL